MFGRPTTAQCSTLWRRKPSRCESCAHKHYCLANTRHALDCALKTAIASLFIYKLLAACCRSVQGGDNLAYTSLPLSCHTDNPYRDPYPGIQLLHCIVPASGERAGLSLLADGFAVADALRASDPLAFEVLSTVARPFDYRDPAGLTALHSKRPPIVLEPYTGDSNETNEREMRRVAAVHYNNRSAGPITDADPGKGLLSHFCANY
eukprot:SAG31_NODE_10217_length_1169_cov_1.614953_1_plen_206_part_00